MFKKPLPTVTRMTQPKAQPLTKKVSGTHTSKKLYELKYRIGRYDYEKQS